MQKFIIICKDCSSDNVELEIGMGQGAGYIEVTCNNCGAEESEEQPH